MIALALLLCGSALAQSTDDDPGLDPTLPIPTMKYDRPPPDYSWEIGMNFSYGDIVYFKQEIAPWVGYGFRFGWGKNFTDSYAHRIGVQVLLFAEGPIPIHSSIGLEPHLAYDYISKKGLWLGAGVGGAAMYNHKDVGFQAENSTAIAPSAAVRVGWSQTWSRVGRRLFVGLEPRIRFANNNVAPQVALVLGSGRGY